MWLFSSGEAKREEDKLNNFIEHAPVAIVELTRKGVIVAANPASRRMLQHGTDAPMKGHAFTKWLNDAEKQEFASVLSNPKASSKVQPLHYVVQLSEEQKINVSVSLVEADEADEASNIYLYLTDVTEQKNLEMRFAHSQKMQAVGQLAGGVAHDFNNLLTAMIGFCDLLLMRHPAGDPSFADIMQIKQNANRAANLVRQLLAFSRRQTLQPKEIDLVDLLSELTNLIRRLIGENIELNISHQRGIWPVKVDQGQIEQVLINLAVNARDAMKEGGSLRVQTENISVTDPSMLDAALRVPAQEDTIIPGDYVAITITDTGTGIPEHVIDNIFEPFFSTKEVGSGTGLGLSTVYGIIKQTGGYVYLKTEENVGTSFVIYIPRLVDHVTKTEEEASAEKAPRDGHDLTGAATIMLVEDETPVRVFAARALQNKGYQVLEADCAEAGLEVYAQHKHEIEVIVTDVVMPGINGAAMIEQLDRDYSDSMKDVGVIFMSGYAEEAFADGYDGGRDFNFLAKPFTLKQLAAKIKEITH